MTRFEPLTPETADGPAQELLEKVQEQMGKIPNVLGTMAHAPAALEAYLGMSGALAKSSLSGAQREAVALAVSQANECDYCVAAHTAIGKTQGLDESGAEAARKGKSNDDKTQAALDFARAVHEKKGWAGDEDVEAARSGGLSDGELLEVIAVVMHTTFTNYVNHLNRTELDFPEVPEQQKVGG